MSSGEDLLLVAKAAVALIFILFVIRTIWVYFQAPVYELHGYQKDFLDAMASSGEYPSPDAALDDIVRRAMTDSTIKKEIFDDFHCVHCGSVQPAEWIKARKGEKTPYKLDLSPEAAAFLNTELLVKVEKVGEPKKRQVIPGHPLRTDAKKAARCCIDWAIKHYDAVADGKFNVEKKKAR